jgi:hypothetical protein
MSFLFLKAYLMLAYFDLSLARRGFGALHNEVHLCPVAPQPVLPRVTEEICTAVEAACIWYWKEVLCLQRSVASACLLRRHGVAARIVIGIQHIPFKAHAWVEVDGRVVNDKEYLREIYAVLEQC